DRRAAHGADSRRGVSRRRHGRAGRVGHHRARGGCSHVPLGIAALTISHWGLRCATMGVSWRCVMTARAVCGAERAGPMSHTVLCRVLAPLSTLALLTASACPRVPVAAAHAGAAARHGAPAVTAPRTRHILRYGYLQATAPRPGQ